MIIPGEDAELHVNGHEFSDEELNFEKEPEGEELTEVDFKVDAETDDVINEGADAESDTDELADDDSIAEDDDNAEEDSDEAASRS